MNHPLVAEPIKTRPFAALTGWIRFHPYTVVAALLFLGLAVPFYARTRSSEWDQVFVRAAANMLHGRDMYQANDGYLYPPFMAWLSIPFTYLPQGLGRMVFYALNVLCVVLLCRWAWTLSGGRPLQHPATPAWEHLVFWLGMACGFRYVLDGLSHQQVDIILGCLVMGGCFALSRSRPWSAATALGLAAAMKCTPLLWCPYLIWRRRWLPAAWLVVVAVGVNFLPDLVNPSPTGRSWAGEWLTRYIAPLQQADPGAWGSDIIYNQSLSGLGNRFFTTQGQWTDNDFDVSPSPTPMSPTLLKEGVLGVEGLLLPGFCLARQAWTNRNPILAALLGLAILTGMLSIRGIWGEKLYTFALWWGSITWCTLCLFGGCWFCLKRLNFFPQTPSKAPPGNLFVPKELPSDYRQAASISTNDCPW